METVNTTNGITGQQTTVGYSATGASPFTLLGNLQEVPDLGGKLDKVESTTLSSTQKTYIAGLMDPGDLAFKFRYDTTTFKTCKGLEGETITIQVTYPDGSTHTFGAQIANVVDSVKTGALVTFTMNVVVVSQIVFAAPATS